MKFIDKGLRALKTEKPTEIFRSEQHPGFAIEVSRSGSKKFVFIYKIKGFKRKMPLGRFPDGISLANATEKWIKARNLLKSGTDPQAPEPCPEPESEAPKVLLLGDLADDYLEKYSKKHHTEVWHYNLTRAVKADIEPTLGHRPAAEITRAQIIELMEATVERAPGQAATVLKALKAIFDFGIMREKLITNPCYLVKMAVPSINQESRKRYLSDDEIRHMWSAVDKGPGSLQVKCALKLLLITAQRPEEVAQMKTEDIEKTEDGLWIWNMPISKQKINKSKKRKKKNDISGDGENANAVDVATVDERPIHRVFLTELAKEFIIPVEEGYIFRGPGKTNTKPITRCSISKLVWREVQHKNSETKMMETVKLPYYGLAEWTPHDLRRTARTLMGRAGVSKFRAKRVIGHSIGGIEGVYDRYKYDPQKKAALITWEEELLRVLGKPAPPRETYYPGQTEIVVGILPEELIDEDEDEEDEDD